MTDNIKTTVEELHKLINVDNIIGTQLKLKIKYLFQ